MYSHIRKFINEYDADQLYIYLRENADWHPLSPLYSPNLALTATYSSEDMPDMIKHIIRCIHYSFGAIVRRVTIDNYSNRLGEYIPRTVNGTHIVMSVGSSHTLFLQQANPFGRKLSTQRGGDMYCMSDGSDVLNKYCVPLESANYKSRIAILFEL